MKRSHRTYDGLSSLLYYSMWITYIMIDSNKKISAAQCRRNTAKITAGKEINKGSLLLYLYQLNISIARTLV